jgi:hypothetical protein
MARRTTKVESLLIAAAVFIGIPIYVVISIFESAGWTVSIVLILVIVLFGFWYQRNKSQSNLEYLKNKYKDEEVVRKISNHYFWKGQSAEQLRDSLGLPEAIENKLLKTKNKEIWKYYRSGSNRFSLRITLENSFVVGWDDKI